MLELHTLSWLKTVSKLGTSLVAQRLRIHPPMQGTWVRSPGREDPHAVKQLSPCATTTEPALYSPRATTTEVAHLEPVLCNKRSHHNEKPAHCNKEEPLLNATRESPRAATKTQCSQNKQTNKKTVSKLGQGEQKLTQHCKAIILQ